VADVCYGNAARYFDFGLEAGAPKTSSRGGKAARRQG
jgi:hypothetical protein